MLDLSGIFGLRPTASALRLCIALPLWGIIDYALGLSVFSICVEVHSPRGEGPGDLGSSQDIPALLFISLHLGIMGYPTLRPMQAYY
jgi:hypothetical protein